MLIPEYFSSLFSLKLRLTFFQLCMRIKACNTYVFNFFFNNTQHINRNSPEDTDPDAHLYDETTMEGCFKYHNVSEYHASRKLFAKSLTFFNSNIRSYKTNSSILHGIFNGYNTYQDFMTHTETWVTDSNAEEIGGFRSIDAVPDGRSGGVSVFIKEHLNFTVLGDFTYADENIEIYAITPHYFHTFLYVLSIYRPYNGPVDGFVTALGYVLGQLNVFQRLIMVMSETIITLLKDTPDKNTLIKSMQSFHF